MKDRRGGAGKAAPRVPIQVEVDLKFDDLGSFLQSMTENLSLGGMFLRSDEPKPVGTVFGFRFALSDDAALIQGAGKVVWVRGRGQDDDLPAGMGIRFVEIEGGGRDVIETIVSMRLDALET